MVQSSKLLLTDILARARGNRRRHTDALAAAVRFDTLAHLLGPDAPVVGRFASTVFGRPGFTARA